MNSYHGVIFTDYGIGQPSHHQRTLGAYAIADLLRRRGLKIKIVDFTFSWTQSELVKICKRVISRQTYFIGLSSTFLSKSINLFSLSTTNMNDSFSIVVKASREINPHLKVIQGGGWAYSPHPLADKIFSGQSLENEVIKYVSELVPNCSQEKFNFLDEIPEFIDDDLILSMETLPIETARGCIFNCKFCGFTMRGKKKNDHVRAADAIANQIARLENKFQTTNFFIAEDTFNESVEKISAFNAAIRRRNLQPRIVCYARIDLIYRHPEMLKQLYESGVRAIMFGLETFNRKAGLAIGKGLSPDIVKSLLLQIRENYPDLYLGSGFILGLPGEELESVMQTNKWLINSGALNHWNFQPLYLDTDSRNPNRSEFSKNSAHYGYQVQESIGWKNGGLSFLDCYEASEILNESNESQGHSKAYPWTLFAGMQYMDFTQLSLMTNTEIYTKIKNTKFDEYKKLWRFDSEITQTETV